MIAAIRSEWRKYLTTKLWWILLIVVVCGAALYAGLYGGLTAITVRATDSDADVFTTPATLSAIYNGGNTLTRILALVLGVMAMGAEYRHKTLASTYLATPHRWVVLAAKTIVVALFGALYGIANAVAGIVVALPLVGWFGGGLSLGDGGVWRSLLLGVLSLALWALLGMGVGILIRNMVVALLVAIAFAYMVEPLVSLIFAAKDWSVPLNLMPSGATSALVGLENNPLMMAPSNPFSWWLAGLVLLAWAAIPTVIGIVTTIGRDVE